LTFSGMLRILVFTAFSILFILLVGYLLSPSLFFLMGDSPIDYKLSFKDSLQWSWQTVQSRHCHCHYLFCLFDASYFNFDIFLWHLSHTLWSLLNWGSFSVIQGRIFLKLFLTLLCLFSLNGLQHKALVIRDAIIIVNTLNQQNWQHKVNISYTEAEKSI
jgi:hypothetical protein